MSYNWINAKDYTMNCFLLFDRWALKWLSHESIKGGILYYYRKQVRKEV